MWITKSKNIKDILTIIKLVIIGVVIIGLAVSIFPFLFMIIWNGVMPSVFGMKPLSFIDSFFIILLIQIVSCVIGSFIGSRKD